MPVCVGIAGGTGSGKSTISRAVASRLPGKVSIVEHDWYYHDQQHLPPEERPNTNYDHPDALDTALLAQHLRKLLAGESVEAPIYDFTAHIRARDTRPVEARPVIVVEGIHVLGFAGLRALMDLTIYVDVAPDLRFIRRLQRDVIERGRTVDSVTRQYLDQVRPMHLRYVKPTREHADLVVPEREGDWDVARIVNAIQGRLATQ